MKKVLNEFKEFAVKGNVIDMAVGVIIGGAFGKIVTSLVNDIIMPLIGLIFGRISLAHLSVTIASPNQSNPPVVLQYGLFLQNILDLLLVAASIFSIIKLVNRLRHRQDSQPQEPEAPPEPAPTREEGLLTEIRDILRNNKL